MEWIGWVLALIAVLAMVAWMGNVFMNEGLSGQQRGSSTTGQPKRRRLSPSRWML